MRFSGEWLLIPDDVIQTEGWDRLRQVYDPEIGSNLVDLGLIYDLTSERGKVRVTMTLTTPGCRMSQSMPHAVQRVMETIPGVVDVVVDLVWDPGRITEEGNRTLGWLD